MEKYDVNDYSDKNYLLLLDLIVNEDGKSFLIIPPVKNYFLFLI